VRDHEMATAMARPLNMFASHDLEIEAEMSASRTAIRRRGCASPLLPNKELVCSRGCLRQRISHS
jgi:hypothetical protein